MKKYLAVIFLFQTFSFLNAQNLEWARMLASSNILSDPKVQIDKNENIYITGSFQDSLNLSVSSNPFTIYAPFSNGSYIAKYNKNGNIIYARTIDGQNSNCISNDLAIDDSLNLYVLGTFSDSIQINLGNSQFPIYLKTKGKRDIFLLKIDSSGNTVWGKSWGGTENDFGGKIKLDKSGNIFFISSFNDRILLDTNSKVFITKTLSINHPEMFIMKLNSSGHYIWAKQISSSNFCTDGSIDLFSNGSIAVSGYFFDSLWVDTTAINTNAMNGSSFIAKFSNQGQLSWLNYFEVDTGKVRAHDLLISRKEQIFLCGTFSGRNIDFDPGNLVFKRSAGSNNIGPGVEEGFLVVIDTLGSLNSIKFLKGQGSSPSSSLIINQPFALTQDFNGNTYLTGEFIGIFDFNPDLTNTFTLSTNFFEAFICKLDSNLDFNWAIKFPGGRTRSLSLAVDINGKVVSTGTFIDSMDVDPSIHNLYLYNNGSFNDAFLLKIDQRFVTQATIKSESSLSYEIYPNPTESDIWIDSNGNANGVFELYNSEGKFIKKVNHIEDKTSFKIPSRRGLYYLIIKTDNKIETKKIIKL